MRKAIVAITKNGMLLYKLVDGAANAVVFEEFLNEMVNVLPENAVIVMDNVRFHHGYRVHQWASSHPLITIEYLPPYSPELNPIEEFFHMEKSLYRKKNRPIARSREIMRQRVASVLESFLGKDLSGLYYHMRQNLAKAYAGQSFV